MQITKWIIPFGIIIFICAVFSYPIFQGAVPFPGDLLVGNYTPYKTVPFDNYPPGGVPHKAQGPDVIRQLFPWKYLAITQLLRGQMPFWNPYNFSGNPLLANFQSAPFSPFNIFFFILPFAQAWTFLIFSGPVFSAFFLFLYLREINISQAISVFSGIVFAFCGYMVVWMEYGNIGQTLLWLPLALFFTERLLKHFSLRNTLFLTLALLLSLFSGYIQGYFYIVAVVFFYGLMKFPVRKAKPQFFIFTSAVFVPFGLALFQILPLVDLFLQSSRGNYDYDTFTKLLNPLWYTITLIAPDFFGNPASRNHWFYGTYIERVSYIGFLPFFFSLIAIFRYKDKPEIRIFTIVFLVSFVLAYDFLFSRIFSFVPIPVLSTTVPTRILGIFSFSAVVLSAIGLDLFLKKKTVKIIFPAFVLVTLFIFAAWLVILFGSHFSLSSQDITVSKRNILLPTAVWGIVTVLFFTPLKNKKNIVLFAIFVITFLDLFRFFHKITPFSPEKYIYPQTPVVSFLQKNAGINRFWGYGDGYIDTNFQMVDTTYSPDGTDALHIKRYTELLAASKNGTLPADIPRADANIAPGYGDADLRNNTYRQKLLNILGVKYVLHRSGTVTSQQKLESPFDESQYKLVWQQAPWQVYENKTVVPRAFITTDYKVVIGRENIISAFYEKSFNEKSTLILEENPHIKKQTVQNSMAEVVSYKPNDVTIKTKAPAEAMLFFSDTYYPDWKAYIDGKETKIFVANYAFRAVKIPRGEHTVVFSYSSGRFNTGIFYSVVVFLGYAFFLFIMQRKFFSPHSHTYEK